MSERSLKIVHLYPKEMNIYGDTGNVLVVKMRSEWHGVRPEVIKVGLGDNLPVDTDIIISGGGQDQGQIKIRDDLQKKRQALVQMSNDGVAMLVVCGTYQLFGHRFITHSKDSILGTGIFDMETLAGGDRLIGNIVINTHFGELVGYENHSGLTTLAEGQKPFGKVVKGVGNNEIDKTEGAHINNTFGTYLHGPILPKNPKFADELIRRALVRKYGDAMLNNINDDIALKAAEIAKDRPR